MAIYYPGDTCQSSVPEHLCNPCLPIELGGVRTVLFIDKDFVITNPSSPSQWNSGIQSRSIIIIPKTYGTFDGGTPQEGQGFGDTPTSLDGYDFTLQFFDPNFIGNVDHYDSLKNLRSNYKVAFRTGSQIIISDKVVTIIPKMPVAQDLKSKVLWDVTVKWTSQNLPGVYDAPPVDWDCVQII